LETPLDPVTLEMVRTERETGCIIGTCSDHPLSVQKELMERQDIQMDFVSLKHELGEIRAAFEAERYYHVGDSELDGLFAIRAGFDFLWMEAASSEPWIALQ